MLGSSVSVGAHYEHPRLAQLIENTKYHLW